MPSLQAPDWATGMNSRSSQVTRHPTLPVTNRRLSQTPPTPGLHPNAIPFEREPTHLLLRHLAWAICTQSINARSPIVPERNDVNTHARAPHANARARLRILHVIKQSTCIQDAYTLWIGVTSLYIRIPDVAVFVA